MYSDRANLLQGLSVDHFILDTQAQLQDIQLFSPPPGVSLPTFIDALLRIFSATYKLESASAILLHKALIEAYEKYKVQANNQITLSKLTMDLERILQRLAVPTTPGDALHTRVLPSLQELAMSAVGTMHVASSPLQELWTTMPTVIELGLIGDDMGQTFLRGCLWAWFSLALATRRITHGIRGIVTVEDAHTIFSRQSDAPAVSATSVVSLAQASACNSVGTLLIDNRPDLLSEEVISEARAIIVTGIRNQSAQETVTQLMRASLRERERLRNLSREEAIVLAPGTSPVLIRPCTT